MNQIGPNADRAPWLCADNQAKLPQEKSDYRSLDILVDAPMESEEFLRLAIGIASALAKVHQSGLVHKDIKPTNILVNPDNYKVSLTGFGLASRLTRERQRTEPPEAIAGTLAYMAPEQTGRMNRSVDSRSDLYAFGVTLYQMLTGSLPFIASDPIEWVHCHIARMAVPPHERVTSVAPVLSAIVMKLLAKTAEERYQTATGVEIDLRRCLAQWETNQSIEEFPLGDNDAPHQLMIPETLYGRAREVETLLGIFNCVIEGSAPELVLVSGYSGIGKSSVVNELHRVLAPSHALFASGKFDQYKHDIPYSTLAQAFRNLLRPLLGQSEAELTVWREALRDALGPNAGLVVDLVPEIALIIGQPAPVPELLPQEAHQRFQLMFRRFIDVFARPEHPLVLFLDDLQWLDAATFDLIEDLLTRPHPQNLLLIGAYRDNEVNSAHLLIRKIDAIKAAGGKVTEIALAPLTRDHLEQLMADALRCKPEQVAPLAWLVYDKTAGNPFFAIQFISSLTDEGMLVFNYDAARWSWDLDRIHTKGFTENVVELIVDKLTRLSTETLQDLQLLACMGNSAELALLETISRRPEADLHAHLWEAIRAGLIGCSEESCRFVHDRVQEATYSLIPVEERAQIHLQIGRTLVTCTLPEKQQEMIFEIVNQLNRGAQLIASQDERENLAELNLIAGKRAKASSAYTSAMTYLRIGAALLGEDAWARRQELAFALDLQGADCELWAGALPPVEERLAALATHAADNIQRAAVAIRRVDVYTMLGDSDRAVAVGLEYLRHVGIEWSDHPTQLEAIREYGRIWSQVGNRTIEDLIDLPLMKDSECLATLDLLITLGAPTLYTDGNLYVLTVCRAVNLCLERGNSDAAVANYAAVGLIAGDGFGQYDAGYRLGKLACDLTERGLKRLGGKTYLVFALMVPWTRPFRECVDSARRAFQMANEQCDPTFAAYACRTISSALLASGEPLDRVELEAEEGLEFSRMVRFEFAADMISSPLALVRTLRGKATKFGSLDSDLFTESSFEARLTGHPAQALPECFYWIRKLQARFFVGDYTSAIDAAEKAEKLFSTSASLSVFPVERAEYHLYAALSRAACCDLTDSDQYAKDLEVLQTHQRQLQAWSKNCPQNFEDRAALVAAEITRLEGRSSEATDLYERAIRLSRSNGVVQNEALSYELAARYYAARGLEEIANLYLGNARRAYLRWGAFGKVRQLDHFYPGLKQDERPSHSASMIDAPVEDLDLATVIKVSQAVSGEIVPEKFIESLLHTAIEHAGADRGLLVLPNNGELLIRAEAKTCGASVSVSLFEMPVSADVLPESVIRYAARAEESVILNDTSVRSAYSSDEYISKLGVRSILCLPLIKQGKLVALLYLENRLASGAFTPSKISVLKVIASQAAISLENSSLYRELQKRESKISRLVDANIVGIMMWDRGGEILEANDAFLRTVGYQREDLVSGRLRWSDLTPPESLADELEQILPQLELTGSVQPYEKECLHKDGRRVPVLVGAAAFDEEYRSGVAFVVDMTERKQVEEELRRSRQYLAEAQKVSHTGSWAWCPAPKSMLYWSEECYRILGYDPAHGMPSFSSALERFHPDDRSRVLEEVARHISNRVEFEVECRLSLPDGNVRHVRILAHPVSTTVGNPMEYIGTVIDVTERKRAEKEHEEYLWFLECMNRINRVMQRTNEVEEMTRGVLEEALAIFNCDRAWLVYPCDPDAPTYRALIEHTSAAYPGAFALGQELSVDAQTAASMRDILRAQGAVVDPDMPPEIIRRFSILSAIVIAVRPKGGRPYLFGLHQCSHIRAWTNVERRLIEEIGGRLEDALTSALAHRNLLASEDALRTSEERFRTLVDHATDAIFLYDEDGIVLDVNHQACETLGYSREELIGMRTDQFDLDISPANAIRIKQQLQEVGSVTFNGRRQRKDGSHFPVEVRARAFNRGGRLFAIALASDITDRRRHEQRLLVQFTVTQTLSEAGSFEEVGPRILREICESLEWTRAAFWRVDQEADVLVRAQTWPSATTAHADSALVPATEDCEMVLPSRVWPSGTPTWIPDMTMDVDFQRMESVSKEGLRSAFAFPITVKSSILGVIELSSLEVRQVDPELLETMHSVGCQIGQFIERMRAEDALHHAREKLSQASRLATVAELSASIAHEINQPLQSVVAHGQACRRWLAVTPPDIDKARLSVEAIIRDGYATADVISRVRALFQRTAPAKIKLDINKLILQVCALMADDIHRGEIWLETQLAYDVPTIKADAVQIQQVIVNLVRNAIEALSAIADQPKSLLIRSRREGNDVVVDVQDEGTGLANLETIFEPFTTTKETGMGMGLAICRSILAAHSGDIWVVRNQIRGVTFSFRLPTVI